MRKKWCLIIGLLSVFAVSIVYFSTRERTIPVDTVTLSGETVKKTISCDGIIEAGEREAVFVDTACFIKEVVVQEGTYVEAGTPLAIVDKTATKNSGQGSELSALILSTMPDEVLAPVSGIVLKLEMQDGSWMEDTAACAIMAPADSIRVRVAIREKYLPLLHSGLTVSVTGEGLQNGSYAGTLQEISSKAQNLENGGTVVEGVIELDDVKNDPSLRLGINVKAAIVVKTVNNGIVIPYEAVSKNDNKTNSVFVLTDGALSQHPIDMADELPSGILLSDADLNGKTIVANAKDVIADVDAKYVSAEDSE